MKKEKGFTLIELVVVLVIVGILSVSGIVIYRGYVKESISTEGKTLIAEVSAAEEIYFSRRGNYLAVAETRENAALGVDTKRNKYFRRWSVSTLLINGGDSFIVTTESSEDGAILKRTGSQVQAYDKTIDDNNDYSN